MYNSTRLEDILELKDPYLISTIPTFDVVRIFNGDGPARQYECGHQRGGNFRCLCGINVENHRVIQCAYTQNVKTLEERRQLVLKGRTYMQDKDIKTNPFSNLKKAELEQELASRGKGTLGLNKSELQTELNDILNGIARLPALMTVNPNRPAEDINLGKYEIMNFEPLHQGHPK
ncbi:unnamed protein product [Mytilus edulis]|uniref:Uncharacterized protein n=1 Tax=Mytilus edulis TaxID=6550 RepID=A0A8S3RXG2_MYTED|nr:unnamed protein product [Mytilus edulis]